MSQLFLYISFSWVLCGLDSYGGGNPIALFYIDYFSVTAGSYVALTLMGKPNPSTVAASGAHPQAGVSSSFPGSVNNTQSNRNSFLGHITAPQPVDVRTLLFLIFSDKFRNY